MQTKTALRGFTLIELLVVITIIVVLLAMLTPALDKAIYQAQLAVCGTNLKGIGSGVSTYAIGFKRHYPIRPNGTSTDGFETSVLTSGGPGNNRDPQKDLRVVVRDYVNVKQFVDPLLGEVDVSIDGSRQNTTVSGDYHLWSGYQYANSKGLLRLGNRWGWDGKSYKTLAGCASAISLDNSSVNSIHPDRDGVLTANVFQEEDPLRTPGNASTPTGGPAQNQVWERYENLTTYKRGGVDVNFMTTDGAVSRYNELEWFEGDPSDALDPKGRFDWVPRYRSGQAHPLFGIWWIAVPAL